MNRIILIRLALRSVWREARRSVLTCSAMALGLALLVFSRSLAEGGHEDWVDAGVRMGTGHVVTTAPGFLDTGSIDDRLSPDQTAAAIDAVEKLAAAGRGRAAGNAPHPTVVRFSVNGLASSATSALPVRVEGVEPTAELDFSFFPSKLVDGRYLEPDDRQAAFVGTGLVERLDLKLGSRFVVTAQAASGDIEGQLLRVVGIFRTGLLEADEGLVHLPLETARSWLGAPDAATTVSVLVDDSRDVLPARDSLRAWTAGNGVEVKSWQQATPELYAAIRLDDYGDWIFHAILFGIIALAVLNSVLMGVMYRHREFGVLQALGLTPGETGWVVLLEGLLLTALAGLVGIVLGLAITWGIWRDGLDFSWALSGEFTFSGIVLDPVVVPVFRVKALLQSLLSIAIVGLVASVYPAVHAMRIDVAESMKFER